VGVTKEEPKVLVGVRLPESLARALKVEAARRGTTVQALVEEAVRTFLAHKKGG
jgi:predicted DNA binding CopG/RHH family protein